MKTLLIDSQYLCYRAFYTTGTLSFQGIPTGIYYGFINQLITAAKAIEPDKVIFFWDSKKSKRKEIFPDYKKKRNEEKTPEEIEMWQDAFKQFRFLQKKILPELGFNNNLIQIGYESDDLIADYTINSPKNEHNYIVTGDDDLLQLLKENCFIYCIKDDLIYTEQDFKNDLGIDPIQWIEVKKIAGCKSDSVPGVAGVGEKTAIKYLKDELKESTKTYQKIQKSKDLILFNEKLVSLPYEKTIDTRNKTVKNAFSMKAFLRMCREFDFNTFRTDEKKEEVKKLFNSLI